jgi:two-component system sensor histidine kinase TctE
VCEFFEPLAAEQGIVLELGSAEEAVVSGEPAWLHQCVANLVDNAIRYTRPGGHVTTRVLGGDRVALEVEDNGIGIEEAERDLVFERFYRVLGTETEGSGLGLSIVRGIALLHRADVLLEPNPRERGTLARVVFSRVEPAQVRLRPAA